MKNFTLTLMIAAALIGFSISGNAQTNTASSSADATFVTAITLQNTRGLSFGYLTTNGTATTVSMNSAGTLTQGTGTATVPGGAITTAEFTVTGSDYDYTVTVPASAVTLAGVTSGMTVDNFNTSLTSFQGTIASGTDTFTVGADLNIPATTADGTYTGTFNVTVDYL